jgi:hypothetical protein
MGVLVSTERDQPYRLSVEGLDNYPDVTDQRARLAASLEFLASFLPAGAVR